MELKTLRLQKLNVKDITAFDNKVKLSLLNEWEQLARLVPIRIRQPVDGAIRKVFGTFETGIREAFKLLDNGDWSDEARRRKLDQIKQDVVKTCKGEVEKLNLLIHEETEKLNTQLAIPKPDGIDQGELLNLKSDLKMLLDALTPPAAMARLGVELERALETKDEAKTWLLGASDWPAFYLESRGRHRDEWDGVKKNTLVNRQNSDQAELWRVLNLLTDQQKGLPMIVRAIQFYASISVDYLP